MQKLVSVIIPVYNTGVVLEECVKSVVNSTYKKIEIIIIDDGSDKETANICDYLSKQDSRVTVFHENNGGVSNARNKGIEYSHGEYIMFVDSDDKIDNTAISLLVKALEESESDMSCGEYREWYPNNKYVVRKTNFKNQTYEGKDILEAFLLENRFGWNVWGKLFKRDVLEGVLFPENKRAAEDMYFLSKVAAKAKKVVCISDVLYSYRKQGSSAMSDSNIAKFYDIYEMIEQVKEDLSKTNDKHIQDCCDVFYIRNTLWFLRFIESRDKTHILYENNEQTRKRLIKIDVSQKKHMMGRKTYFEFIMMKHAYPIFKMCGKITISKK